MDTGAPATETTAPAVSEAPQQTEKSVNDKIADVVKSKFKEFSEETPKRSEEKPYVSDKADAPKEVREAEKPEKVAKPDKEEKPQPIKAPHGWTKEEKAEFEKLSETAKKAILRADSEKESLLGRKSREFDNFTKQTKEAVETHDYVKQVAQKVGAPNARHFIERMVEAQEQSVKDPVGFLARITDHNPIGYVKALMQRYNIDVRALAQGRDDLAFDDYTHQQQTEMQRIKAENEEMKRYFQSLQQQQVQYQEQSARAQEQQTLGAIETALETFYADRPAEERAAAEPYLEHAVRVVIAEAAQRGEQISSYGDLVRRAHTKALRLNDSYTPSTHNATYASSRAVSPASRAGGSTGIPQDRLSGNFNDKIGQIVRNNLRKFS